MALAVVTCISSWRGHMKQSSKDELEALQEVARKGIVYVRNWDQSDISRAIFNPEVRTHEKAALSVDDACVA
jgi:hypothetical protein